MKIDYKFKERYGLADVVEIVHLLRDPVNGCPWDKEQTHQSIRKNFLEEAYEACDAIDKNDKALLREELGDVLLQVALHSEMESEQGVFSIDDVADELCKKLIVRHPHIFGEVSASDSAAVLDNWEAIKRSQKGMKAGSSAIDDVPAAFPALYKSQKVQKRARDAGFDYENVSQAFGDLKSEVDELESALRDGSNIEEEVGDAIFACVNVARLSGIDAEHAAEKACEKFKSRYKTVEDAAAKRGIDMKNCGIDILNDLWKQAKNEKRKENNND